MTREDVLLDRPLVLIVDDDEALRFMAREALENEGFAVVEADDGVPALEMFETLRPDVILLDLVMKSMDGYETCSLKLSKWWPRRNARVHQFKNWQMSWQVISFL